MNKLLFFILFIGCFHTAFSQEKVDGILVDTENKPIGKIKIRFQNTEPKEITTDSRGFFSIHCQEKPRPISFSGKNMVLKTIIYTEKAGERMKITVGRAFVLKGKILDKGQPVAGAKFEIVGMGEAITAKDGTFELNLADDFQPKNAQYKINGISVSHDDFKWRDANHYLETQKPDDRPKLHTYEITIVDPNGMPINQALDGIWGDANFKTDATGIVKIQSILTEEKIIDAPFAMLGYEFVKVEHTSKTDFRITVRKNENATVEKVAEIEEKPDNLYAEDFNNVINKLELDKQILKERSMQIHSDISQIQFKLQGTKDITQGQRNALKGELESLEAALVNNEVAYEDAQAKTREVVDQMKLVVQEKDSLNKAVTKAIEVVEKVQEEKAQEERLFILIALFLLGLVLVMFIAARRIRKEKNEVLRAYRDIATLSDIGQKVSATLDFANLVETVHKNVDMLMDASVFGVGAYHEKEGMIVFRKFYDEGQIIPHYEENINNKNKFAVWCIKNLQPVLVQDLAVDFKKYLEVDTYNVVEGMPKSLIYLPLITEGKAVGVITVQSLKKAAYSERELTLLSTLASYVAIALVNSRSYEVIQEKNKNITDSIRYAKTIQQAILPSNHELKQSLGEYFSIYRPKDIVSGDFYWFVEDIERNKKFIAAVDCTGHGVPGAFMSMIGYSMLNETIKAKKIYDPALILEYMDGKIKETLKQDETANDDGMDICFCLIEKINPNEAKISFAGAKRPLYYVQKNQKEVQQLKGDSKSIGGANLKEKNFSNKEVILQKGDMVFLSSDGIIDQANDQKEKFGTPKLLDILQKNAQKPIDEQKKLIEQALDEHRQNTEQRDDILLIGIRI